MYGTLGALGCCRKLAASVKAIGPPWSLCSCKCQKLLGLKTQQKTTQPRDPPRLTPSPPLAHLAPGLTGTSSSPPASSGTPSWLPTCPRREHWGCTQRAPSSSRRARWKDPSPCHMARPPVPRQRRWVRGGVRRSRGSCRVASRWAPGGSLCPASCKGSPSWGGRVCGDRGGNCFIIGGIAFFLLNKRDE